MMKRTYRAMITLAAVLLMIGIAAPASAQVPNLLTQQGRLFDTDGQPINDTLQFTFAVYTDASGGTAVVVSSWT